MHKILEEAPPHVFAYAFHMKDMKGGGYLFNYSLILPPTLEALRINRAVNAESSPLHIASSWTRTWEFWFLRASC